MSKLPDETESIASVSRRMYAAISYVVVLFGIGIPMWWYTTQLYRMSLPDDRMQSLGIAPLTIKINVIFAFQSNKFEQLISTEINEYFNESDIININIISSGLQKNWLPDDINSADKIASTISVNIGDIMLIEWPDSPYEILVTSHRVIYCTNETTGHRLKKMLSKLIFQEETLHYLVEDMYKPGVKKQTPTIRRSVTAAEKYDVMITVVNPDPESISIDWNVKQVAFQYLLPFFNSINHISNITLKSQWLYYVSVGDNLKIINEKSKDINNNSIPQKQFGLIEDQLPYLITMFEKKLSSHISKNPCLNLIVYVTDCKHTPLNFYNSKGEKIFGPNAFMSPRWGGIIFVNPDLIACQDSIDYNTQAITQPDSQYIMSIFITQIRQLLGIPELETLTGVYVLPLNGIAPRKWEMDALMRLRTFEQIVSARITLKSLAQLLTEITTIVINDDVGASIHSAVDNAEKAAYYLSNNNLQMAFDKSRMAFLSSEAAFYDPSLLALLYFPDDQKYAIYIPLFLPITIPVIMSLNTIRQWLMKKPKTD